PHRLDHRRGIRRHLLGSRRPASLVSPRCHDYLRPPRTAVSIRSAAATGSSCSHTRTTLQPSSARVDSVVLSLRTVAASFSRHHSRFPFGSTPCSGQLCQKQPST